MSTHWDILTQAKFALEQLNALDDATIVVRKKPFHSTDHEDGDYLVCLSPAEELISEELFDNQLLIEYPVLITVFQRKGATLQSVTELQWQLEARQAIRRALHKSTLPGVSSVMNTRYFPSPVYDTSGLDELFDISKQQFNFTSNEVRSE